MWILDVALTDACELTIVHTDTCDTFITYLLFSFSLDVADLLVDDAKLPAGS